jgi:DNA-binding IclR family transcriptional regulator
VGAELPLHANALGKPMLAYWPDQTIDDLLHEPLARLTSRTLSPAALPRRARAVRERGFAREKDEAILGVSSRTPSGPRRGV